MSEIILKIVEIPQQHVGRGRAIVDPKIIEDTKWKPGQILELIPAEHGRSVYSAFFWCNWRGCNLVLLPCGAGRHAATPHRWFAVICL